MTEAEYQREWLAENFECEGLMNYAMGARIKGPVFTEEEISAVFKAWAAMDKAQKTTNA